MPGSLHDVAGAVDGGAAGGVGGGSEGGRGRRRNSVSQVVLIIRILPGFPWVSMGDLSGFKVLPGPETQSQAPGRPGQRPGFSGQGRAIPRTKARRPAAEGYPLAEPPPSPGSPARLRVPDALGLSWPGPSDRYPLQTRKNHYKKPNCEPRHAVEYYLG